MAGVASRRTPGELELRAKRRALLSGRATVRLSRNEILKSNQERALAGGLPTQTGLQGWFYWRRGLAPHRRGPTWPDRAAPRRRLVFQTSPLRWSHCCVAK